MPSVEMTLLRENNLPLLLVGPGNMGESYVNSILHLGIPTDGLIIHGRQESRARNLAERFDLKFSWGGTPALADVPVGKAAIISASHTELFDASMALLDLGWKYLLIEKPGALQKVALEKIKKTAARNGAKVFIAYNRRFYPSLNAARKIIEEDGGLLSCWFDFTEQERFVLADSDGKRRISDDVLNKWGHVGSSHVVDLFLHFSGVPIQWSHNRYGKLPWHPTGARFCGAGITEKEVSFNYGANWQGAGRWGIELTTANNKLRLQPLEELVVQKKNDFTSHSLKLEKEAPGLKVGIPGLLSAFFRVVSGEAIDERLCAISEAINFFGVADMIFGYNGQDAVNELNS